jgi:LytS/YehU family sensor histidine kinase
VVADEIEFLEHYKKTEALRFEQKFEYKIEVDPTIDPYEVLVPTMILQPFVENAIWHGLSSRHGQGKMRIGFEKSGESLVSSVEDNGKGRETAAKEKDAKHKSKALKITERRLHLLSEEKARPASLELIDLKDGAGNPNGTRVIIRLPFMDE